MFSNRRARVPGAARAAGVMNSVSRVEKLRPQTTEPDSWTHHSEPGALYSMCAPRKLGCSWNISGSRPMTVTTVVSMTGRKRWTAARMAASSAA